METESLQAACWSLDKKLEDEALFLRECPITLISTRRFDKERVHSNIWLLKRHASAHKRVLNEGYHT
jgi:hypothetical protein